MDDTARETMLWGRQPHDRRPNGTFHTDDSARLEHSRNAASTSQADAELLAGVKQFSRDELRRVGRCSRTQDEVARAARLRRTLSRCC